MRGGRYERGPILEEKGLRRKIPVPNETPTGRERRDSKSALAPVLSVTAPIGRCASTGARSRVRTKWGGQQVLDAQAGNYGPFEAGEFSRQQGGGSRGGHVAARLQQIEDAAGGQLPPGPGGAGCGIVSYGLSEPIIGDVQPFRQRPRPSFATLNLRVR